MSFRNAIKDHHKDSCNNNIINYQIMANGTIIYNFLLKNKPKSTWSNYLTRMPNMHTLDKLKKR